MAAPCEASGSEFRVLNRSSNKPIFLPTSLNSSARTVDNNKLVSPYTSLNTTPTSYKDRITVSPPTSLNTSKRFLVNTTRVDRVRSFVGEKTKTKNVVADDIIEIDIVQPENTTDASVPRSPDLSNMSWMTDLFNDDPYIVRHDGTTGTGPQKSLDNEQFDFALNDANLTVNSDITDVSLDDGVSALMEMMGEIGEESEDIFDFTQLLTTTDEPEIPVVGEVDTTTGQENYVTIDLDDWSALQSGQTFNPDLVSPSASVASPTASVASPGSVTTSSAVLASTIEDHRRSSSSDHDYALKYEECETVPIPQVVSNHSKRSRKAWSNEEKESRYRRQRDKNNVASKRSREARKQKIVSLKSNASRLQEENEKLKRYNAYLEELAKETKAYLIQCVAQK